MDDIVQYFVECLLNVKSENTNNLESVSKRTLNAKRGGNLSFEKKYLIHQNINYYLNKKFSNNNLEQNFNKFRY